MLHHAWIVPVPLQQLARFFDFRLTGTARSSLQSLADQCIDDLDATDVSEKIKALDRAAAKEILVARLIVHLP